MASGDEGAVRKALGARLAWCCPWQAHDEMESDAHAVLRLAGQQALASGRALLDPRRLEEACAEAGLGHELLLAALRALAQAGLVDVHVTSSSLVTLLRLTPTGLRRYLATVADLAAVRRRVLAALAEGGVPWRGAEAVDLAGAVGEPALLVETVLEDLRLEGRIVFSPAPQRRFRIHRLADAPPSTS